MYPPFSANFSAYLTFHPLLRKRIALHDRTILIQPLAGVWGGAPTHGRPVRKPLKPHPLQNFISNARWKCAGSGTASRRRCREDSPAVRGKCHEVTKGDGPRAAYYSPQQPRDPRGTSFLFPQAIKKTPSQNKEPSRHYGWITSALGRQWGLGGSPPSGGNGGGTPVTGAGCDSS